MFDFFKHLLRGDEIVEATQHIAFDLKFPTIVAESTARRWASLVRVSPEMNELFALFIGEPELRITVYTTCLEISLVGQLAHESSNLYEMFQNLQQRLNAIILATDPQVAAFLATSTETE